MQVPLIRNSERSDFKTCPAKWDWRWNQGLVPAHPMRDARWFGTCWHLVWAEVYTPPEGKDGFTRAEVDPHEVWDQATRKSYATVSGQPYFGEDDEREFFDAVKLGHAMIDGQLKLWNLDPGWEVLMPEQRFKANIPFNKKQQKKPFSYWYNLGYPRGSCSGGFIATSVGTFDMPILDHTSGRPVPTIVDWKTINKRINSKQANKDDQIGTYIGVATGFARAAGLIPQDMAFEHFMFSFARKAMPPDPDKVDENGRFRNLPQIADYKAALIPKVFTEDDLKGYGKTELTALAAKAGIKVYGAVSKNQGAPLFWREPVRRNKANRLRQISRIADDAEAIAAVRAGIAPILKSPGEHCNWCDFSDLCDIDEDGGDTDDFIRNVFKFSDPYADHYEGARNSKESVTTKKETGVV